MRRVVVTLLLLSAAVAHAGPPTLKFKMPDGWQSASSQNVRYAEVAAQDPVSGAYMLALKTPTPAPISDLGLTVFLIGMRAEGHKIEELKRDFVDIGGVRCGRLLLSITSSKNQVFKQAVYVMPVGDQTASLLFTVVPSKFDALLPTFDAAAQATTGVWARPQLVSSRYQTLVSVLVVMGVVALAIALRRKAARKQAS